MAKNKTTETAADVTAFIHKVENEQQRNDSLRLVEIMRDITGFGPKMWGPAIIGFGSYHYKYASGREGDFLLIGFSPRKDAISLYIYTGGEGYEALLGKLGKYKMGKACIYVKKLSDIDEKVMRKIAEKTIVFLKKTYG